MKRSLFGLIFFGLTLVIGLSVHPNTVYADTTAGSGDATSTTAQTASTPPAETPQYRGELSGLIGDENSATGSYKLNDQLNLDTAYKDDRLNAGLHYQVSEVVGLKAGLRYDFPTGQSSPYEGFDFLIPFGTNLKLSGFVDQNYEGENWTRYESAVRIEMFPNQFLYAGVRGDWGSGAPTYDYRPTQEAILFLKGDFGWTWGKVGLKLDPVLYVEGYWFHDYTLSYQMNDRTSLLLNVDSRYDRVVKYQAGLNWKF